MFFQALSNQNDGNAVASNSFFCNVPIYMGLISFVCGLGSKGLSHALGSNLVKVCVIKV